MSAPIGEETKTIFFFLVSLFEIIDILHKKQKHPNPYKDFCS